MLVRQSFETCTDILKLVNFVQNCFESHGLCPFLLGLRGRKISDGLLSSKDVKEGKGGNYIMFYYSGTDGAYLVIIDLWTVPCPVIMVSVCNEMIYTLS